MKLSAAVVGASGYAGGELLRILSGHPEFEIAAITAKQSAGMVVGQIHPQLSLLASRIIEPTTTSRLKEADVIFLALPHGESAILASELEDCRLIVDLGADFRLGKNTDWQKYYGGTYAGQWTYGLPELPGAREQIAASSRIANPGCYATSVVLGLAPLLSAGLISADDIVVVAASGTSGAGRALKPNLLASEVMGSMSTYKVGGTHQHTPEIEQALNRVATGSVKISFTPLLAPMPRGIIATLTARTNGSTTAEIRGALADAYANEPFVHVLPDGTWPSTSATYGSNSVQIQAVVDEHAGRAIITVTLDNLIKGAAGQAIQNANIALGFFETLALSVDGIAP
ncbi:MAG TPA: N-acetyl-gamma-glutamyl-phosphate reductase [Candidatus Nanopelagicaceae bacterium]|nr:N-acetyl-gamma-glutamyl-phosphate reductase [Candidatus Nanopelagicaceae bacterium]